MNLETDIVFAENKVAVLEVADKKLFLSIVASLRRAEDDLCGEPFMLLNEDKELKASQFLEVVTDVLNPDTANRKIVTKALESLNRLCVQDEERASEFEQLHATMYQKIAALLNELNSDFVVSAEWNLSKYLKAFDFGVREVSAEESFEQLLQYVQLHGEFMHDKILCLVNAKAYFEREEILELYKFSVYNKINLWLIESAHDEALMENERKWIIDADFYEYASE